MTTNQELANLLTEANKPMIEAQSMMHKSLRALACVEVARTVYSRAELRGLLDEIHGLVDADQNARDHYHQQAQEKVDVEKKPGFEGPVDRAAIARNSAERSESMKALKVASDRLVDFKKAHPLASELNSVKRRGLT